MDINPDVIATVGMTSVRDAKPAPGTVIMASTIRTVCCTKEETAVRLAGSSGIMTEKAIRRAAVGLFAEHGFEAASLRMIAEEVGIQASSLYNYITSKEQLLFDLLREPLVALITEFQEQARRMSSPYQRLKLFVSLYLQAVLEFPREVLIGDREVRHLNRTHYEQLIALRDEYSLILTSILADGARAGDLVIDNARVTTFAILAMLSGISVWYQNDGPVDKDEMIHIHTDLVLRMVGLQFTPFE